MEPTVRLEHHLLALEADHNVHVMVELVAPEAAPVERPPLALALVIDRSGSMAGDKLETTKACAAYLARRLGPADQMAVITYDDGAEVVAPLAPGRTEAVLAAIAGIAPGGMTNLSGGWLKGIEVLQGAGPNNAVRRVLLLTDGQANVGVLDPATLVAMAGTARDHGAGTTIIGFGGDFSERLLTAMADAGGGNAHFAPTPEAAPAIFAGEFEGLARLVAQNVSVEVRPHHQVAVVGVLNQYPATAVEGAVQVALGDAYSGERRTLVLALHVPALAEMGVVRVADVVLRYVSLGDAIAAHEVTVPVVVNVVTRAEAATAEGDHEVVEEVVVLRAAQARDEARRLADEGDFEGGSACCPPGPPPCDG